MQSITQNELGDRFDGPVAFRKYSGSTVYHPNCLKHNYHSDQIFLNEGISYWTHAPITLTKYSWTRTYLNWTPAPITLAKYSWTRTYLNWIHAPITWTKYSWMRVYVSWLNSCTYHFDQIIQWPCHLDVRCSTILLGSRYLPTSRGNSSDLCQPNQGLKVVDHPLVQLQKIVCIQGDTSGW